jgi:hypothetical protein
MIRMGLCSVEWSDVRMNEGACAWKDNGSEKWLKQRSIKVQACKRERLAEYCISSEP